MMFKGINLSTLTPTPGERHAFLIGYFESICPWPAARPICKTSKKEIEGEYHYYVGGRFVGFIFLLFILFGIACLVKEVLL